MLWVLICTVHFSVCSCHVTCAFQSESTLYNYLNVKDLLPRNRRKIWSLSNCNWTRTQNHLVRKGTLNHLAKLTKLLSCVLSTCLYGRFDCMFLSCQVFEKESKIYSCLNVKELLARRNRQIWSSSDCRWTQTQNHLVRKGTLNHLVKMNKWWSCVLITYCTVNFTVCSCHVTYKFQSESTLCSCLIFREFLAQSRREIWSLSNCNWTRTENHLLRKQTPNHLAKLTKLLSCVLSTYLYGIFDCMFLSSHVRISEWIHNL